VLFLIILVGAGYAGLVYHARWAAQRELDSAIAAAEEIDPVVSFPDFLAARPTIPADKNSAPILVRAAALCQDRNRSES